jgi:glycosyl transferase family 25
VENLKIFLLNLDRAIDRRKTMEGHLSSLGLQFELISAVDGKKLSPYDRSKYSEEDAIKAVGHPLIDTQIGCALSHARLYERIVAEGIPECLILEDDALLGEMFLKVMEHRNQFPDNWDMINFYTRTPQDPIGPFLTDIYRCSKFLGPASGLVAYLISLKGAKKLLRKVYPIRYEADGLTGRTQVAGINSYGISPAVIAIQDVESTIWDREVVEAHRIKGAKRYLDKYARSLRKRLNRFIIE